MSQGGREKMTDQELCRLIAEKVMGWTAIGQGYFSIEAMKLPELRHLIKDWNPHPVMLIAPP